ncbi:MAG: hypothetical protein IID46_14085 [Planctomycetes bacterium]|nr:hypothetical protein [Planctomycetota bacterium]
MKKHLPIHPVLFAIHPALFLYLHNWERGLSIHQLIRPLGFTLATVLVLWFLLGSLLRSATKGALAASGFTFFFFAYKPAAEQFGLATNPGGLQLLLIGFGILAAGAIFGIAKSRNSMRKTSQFFNLISIGLIDIAPRAKAVDLSPFELPRGNCQLLVDFPVTDFCG